MAKAEYQSLASIRIQVGVRTWFSAVKPKIYLTAVPQNHPVKLLARDLSILVSKVSASVVVATRMESTERLQESAVTVTG